MIELIERIINKKKKRKKISIYVFMWREDVQYIIFTRPYRIDLCYDACYTTWMCPDTISHTTCIHIKNCYVTMRKAYPHILIFICFLKDIYWFIKSIVNFCTYSAL